MAHVSGPQSRHGAPALRFLALCLGGWVVLRIMMVWNPAAPMPPAAVRAPWASPPFAIKRPWPGQELRVVRSLASAVPRSAATRRSFSQLVPLVDGRGVEAVVAGSGGPGGDRHKLRFALAARFLSATMVGRGDARAVPYVGEGMGLPSPSVVNAAPGHGQPYWMRRQMAGWSLSGWLYARDASPAAPGGIAAASQLGASQGGLRIAYGFGETGRLRGYGRATAALQRPQQRELALGIAFAPVRHWPVDLAVEQRLAVGREGRSAIAAMVTGGVSGVALPGDFRLDAYGQAGVVGGRQRDGFADGAVVIDRRLGSDEDARLRLGALAAGAVQPGAARFDVGPRLTLRLPHVGEGSRIALDWRQRIAGDAAPESGVALTLATDF